jgi:hypothetical protein
MNWKKILTNGLIIALFFAVIAFVPDAGNRVLSWLFPPRLYVLIGIVIALILYKILIELRNKNNRDDDE